MPVTPSGSLGKKVKASVPKQVVTEPKKKVGGPSKTTRDNIFIYSFLIVILIEYSSVIAWHYSSDVKYTLFWYPILSNLLILALVLPNVINSDKLKFCGVKKWAFRCLFLYYLMNTITVLFNCQDVIYRTIVNNIFLGLAFVLSVTAILQKNE